MKEKKFRDFPSHFEVEIGKPNNGSIGRKESASNAPTNDMRN
jgi:hypothetical protein